ncbi:MAG TPA: hypothetical protein V6C86_21015 [Oculatellaceae cyanobacterium]
MEIKIHQTEHGNYSDIDVRSSMLTRDVYATAELIKELREVADSAQRELLLVEDSKTFAAADAAVILALKEIYRRLPEVHEGARGLLERRVLL